MNAHGTRSARRGTTALAVVLILGGCLAGAIAAREAESPGSPLQATLEVLRPFTYAGEPLLVRIAVFNTGEKPHSNQPGIGLLSGIRVAKAEGGKLSMNEKETHIDAKQHPAMLGPGGFYGVIQDLTPLVPDLSKPGTYIISWDVAGVSAPPVTVKVIPPFDTSAKYVTVMETDFGYLEFDLLADRAPGHVQNFYDLAMQGFYDNLPLHQIIKGVEIRGGDPTGTGSGYPGYTLQPETSPDLKHDRGTLSMVRMEGQAQDNGSQFVITLAPMARYDGVLSVFGRLRKGEETLKALESIPTTGQFDVPYFKPLQSVVIRSVQIRSVQEPEGGAAGF